MRTASFLTVSIILLVGVYGCAPKPVFLHEVSREIPQRSNDKYTMAMEAFQQEMEKTMDPALGVVPRERLQVAYRQMITQEQKLGKAAISGLKWKELGPKNVGGRTRTIHWLPDKKGVLAAGVSGGLWRCENIFESEPRWEAVNDYFNNLAIVTIAAHPIYPDTLYFGTGEGFFNFDAVRGEGIWRSTDGGLTWSQLSSTNNSNFHYVQKIIVDQVGNIYAGTRNGVYRSTDRGSSWQYVLGLSASANTNRCADLEISPGGTLWAAMGIFTTDGIYKSTNQGTTWTRVYTSSSNEERIEIACSHLSDTVIYGVTQRADNRKALKIIRSQNGGSTWTDLSPPTSSVDGDTFSARQAWYNLILAVDPKNESNLYIGGLDLYKSTNAGNSWTQVAHWYGGGGYPEVHADHHAIVYMPGSADTALFGNDGGLYLTGNATSSTPVFSRKEYGYRTTQFYSLAIHPDRFEHYYLAGTQDNGTQRIRAAGIATADEVTGGDGGFCHIDQQQPDTQITAYTFNNLYISTDGFQTYSPDNDNTGRFINPSDYDSDNNIIYSARSGNQLLRRSGIGGSIIDTTLSLSNFGQASAITVSPNNPTTVYIGSGTSTVSTTNGKVFKITNANGSSPSVSDITGGSFPSSSYVSCIAVEKGNENHLLVTFSNYGVSQVWESTNGGSSWTVVDGNLPDMPVRWAVFSPIGGDSAILATELGVWSTDNLNGGSTVWGRSTDDGMPSVRVDMIEVRPSDSLIVAATHGRGLFTSSVLSKVVTPELSSSQQTVYIGEKIDFYDNSRGTVNSWQWDFDNNGSIDATEAYPSWAYGTPGYKTVKLIINNTDTLIKNNFITVLPNLGTPYATSDGGSFELNPWHFGSKVIEGEYNLWERGAPSNHFGSSAYNGSNAWVTDLDADITEATYKCALYTPDFNMKASGTYTLSFVKSMEVQYCNAPFGVQVQYSVDQGQNWIRLGDVGSGTNWYDRGLSTCGSPNCCLDAIIFGDRTGWTNNYTRQSTSIDISSLAGKSSVRFRIVLSVVFGYGVGYQRDGFLIDDFAISGPSNSPIQSGIETEEFSKAEYLGPNDSVSFYSENGRIIASIINKSTHNFGLTTVEIDTAAIATKNFSTNTDAHRRIMFKTIKVNPSNNDTSAAYDLWMYFTDAEKDSWETATGYSKFLLNLIKSPNDIDSGTTANTIYGNSPLVNYLADSGISVRASFSSGFSGFGAGRDGTLGPLDVSWLSFTGIRDSSNVTLEWKTASERENAYFSIERKTNNNSETENIGEVQGAGNSNDIRTYLFVDHEASRFNPEPLYYRIRQTDFNGKTSYSPWIALLLDQNSFDRTVATWPNPFENTFTLYSRNASFPLDYTIFDQSGRVLTSGRFSGMLQIDGNQWPSGMYLIELSKEGNAYQTLKIFRQ